MEASVLFKMTVIYPTARPFEVVRNQHNFHIRIERVQDQVSIGNVLQDLMDIAVRQQQLSRGVLKTKWNRVLLNLEEMEKRLEAKHSPDYLYTSMDQFANDLVEAMQYPKHVVRTLVSQSFNKTYSFRLELLDKWGNIMHNSLDKQTYSKLVNDVAVFRPQFLVLSETRFGVAHPFTVRVRCCETGHWQDTEPVLVVPQYTHHHDRAQRAPTHVCIQMQIPKAVRSYTQDELQVAEAMISLQPVIVVAQRS